MRGMFCKISIVIRIAILLDHHPPRFASSFARSTTTAAAAAAADTTTSTTTSSSSSPFFCGATGGVHLRFQSGIIVRIGLYYVRYEI
jgi:hypothetical protein